MTQTKIFQNKIGCQCTHKARMGKQSKQGKGQRSGNAKEKVEKNYDSSETPESAGAYCTLTAVKYYWAKAEKAVSLS